MGELDYPQSKLQVLLLLEADDIETIQAAKAARPPDFIRLVVVPPGGPQTKPKACNVGLSLAEGEFLVIYDAEDRPEPGQLREVVAAFAEASADTVCFQARLNYFNSRDQHPHPDVHARVQLLVRRHAAGPGPAGAAHPARRHVEPLPGVVAPRARRVGPVQRDRGRRPGHARRRARHAGGDHRLHHMGGGVLGVEGVDPPAHPLDQGLHGHGARADPEPRHGVSSSGAPRHDRVDRAHRRHTCAVPGSTADLGLLALHVPGRRRSRLPPAGRGSSW